MISRVAYLYKGRVLADVFPVLDGCVVGKVTPQQHHSKSEVITPDSDGRLFSGAAAGKATLAVGAQAFNLPMIQK